MDTRWLTYKQLELLPDACLLEPKYPPAPIVQWIERLKRSLSARLLAGEEPAIWYTRDHQGTLRCHIFDPSTGHTSQIQSDDEFWKWLANRFPQPKST
ncbi:hypothetical protein ACQ4M4_06365 [Leptolyngbya sp. AN02str]|uniref:hypothetical protein n=1 Tax=Leptolyngbya sp. AN02str TaxID=3423363 RepID=UPI003D31F07F